MMTKSNDLLGKILSYKPSQNTLFLVLSKLKEEGRLGEVIQECHKALNLYPDDLRLRTLLAETYGELGFIGLAETEIARVTSRLTGLIPAYKLQAEIYNQQQKNEEALEALNKYLAHRPDDPGALDLLGKIMALTEGVAPETTKDVPVSNREEEKKIEEKLVMEPQDTVEDGETSPEKESEGEEILESVEIPEDITKVLEEKLEGVAVPEAPEVKEDAPPKAQEEGGVFADLATPELAEIYYNQGQIAEAISTYEFVISNDPDDKASTARLAELKASITEEPEQKVTADDILMARKERMITVLEQWLTRIRKLSHG
jgi:tetratricopeptide (TPR) repeat protein